jgi:hypothetical protein
MPIWRTLKEFKEYEEFKEFRSSGVQEIRKSPGESYI